VLFALFLAAGVGLSLGLFGGGASMLSVAVLSFALGMPAKAAIAASLLVTGVTSTAALIVQRRSRLVSVRAGVAFGSVGMVGAFVGSRLGRLLPEAVLLTAFELVMLLTSIAMLRFSPVSSEAGWQRASEEQSVHSPRVVTLAFSIGIVSGMIGAGGGLLIVPALALHGRMPMKRATATSLLIIALQSFAGFVGHLGHSSFEWAAVVPFVLMAALGGAAGAVLAKRARPEPLRRGFAGLVLLVAIVALVQQLSRVVKPSSTHHVFESRS
jgi:uncharacterized membrane protein YfcA